MLGKKEAGWDDSEIQSKKKTKLVQGVLQAVKCSVIRVPLSFSFFLSILFIFRERGREEEREGNIESIGCLPHAPSWGPGLQSRHVP